MVSSYVRKRFIDEGLFNPQLLAEFLEENPDTLKDHQILVNVDEWLAMSKFDFITSLEVWVDFTNRGDLDEGLKDRVNGADIPADLVGFKIAGVDLEGLSHNEALKYLSSSEKHNAMIMARLLYVLGGRTSQELHEWSPSKSFPAGNSYRFSGSDSGLEYLVKEILPSRFVYEDQNQVSNCLVLKRLSRKQF